MRFLRFLSRVAFICNICYVLASLVRYLPNPPEGDVLSTIIVLGWMLGMLVNMVVNVWWLVVWAAKRQMDVPRWLLIVNFIFLIIQLVILFFHHDQQYTQR